VKKEVIQGEEETDKEVDLQVDLHQEENQLEQEAEVAEEAQALLKEDLMLLQKKLKETKLFSFQQQNLLSSKAQNKQHLQNPYFQI